MKKQLKKAHPKGERKKALNVQKTNTVAVDTFGGRVQIDFDHNTPMTSYGQLSFFIEFLKNTGLFDHFIETCPLKLTSNNAPNNRDILGTILLSVLAGHRRYAHMTSVRNDTVNPPLLGMNKIVSEDSVRRALLKITPDEGKAWLANELKYCYEEMLHIPWILDVDTTVKCLYGHQEGAVVGYNPKKPGRPSHNYHTYMIANIRMILDVEVMAGNESASSHTMPHLFNWLDALPPEKRPYLIRGDNAFGTDEVMKACEARGQKYLFKLKQTANVKKFIQQKMESILWCSVGDGWQGQEGKLQLMGWKKPRRVMVLRRLLKKEIGVLDKDQVTHQLQFNFVTINGDVRAYEYAVLVTNAKDEIQTMGVHYRDRADSENNFDELKNQWGWSGYTTQDLNRSALMARMIALIYNWWTLFVRLIKSDKHLEAITSRPLLLYAVGRQIEHAGQKTIQVTSTHAEFNKAKTALIEVSHFFKTLKSFAKQLNPKDIMKQVLYRAFKKFIDSVIVHPPNLLPASG